MGVLYEAGTGVEQDHQKAFEYFKFAAQMKIVSAIFKVGLCYENGIGKSSNFQKALECYNQAAETNYPAALNKLGQIYQRGNKHVKQDIAKGINYYEKAFELNDVDSAYNLGLLYETEEMEESVKTLRKLSNII